MYLKLAGRTKTSSIHKCNNNDFNWKMISKIYCDKNQTKRYNYIRGRKVEGLKKKEIIIGTEIICKKLELMKIKNCYIKMDWKQ